MPAPVRILVVDDELHVRTSLAIWLREEGFEVATANGGEEAIRLASAQPPDIMMVDIKMPGMDGLEVHRRIRKIAPEATVVLMTAYAAVDTAVQALKDGAYDYIVKPFDPEHVSRLVRKAAAQHMQVNENRELRERLESALPRIIATADGLMASAMQQADTVAPTEGHVLIEGEPGSGKELLARRIHARSRRILGPFVRIDCEGSTSALHADLLGQERDNVPRGEPPRRGKLELANEGTLLVRALDCATPAAQDDLERMLQTRKITRLGARATVDADVRVIATSSRDLESLVATGQFSAALYARLRGCRIELPPLRARADDIPLLSAWFVETFATEAQRAITGLSDDAIAALCAYAWPGNVSELRDTLRAAVESCAGSVIGREHLPVSVRPREGAMSLARMEAMHIQKVYELFGHDPARTAAELGIDRAALEAKLQQYGIRKP